MKMMRSLMYGAVASALFASGSALAAVSAEEAAKLGHTLTPMGAEKSGNGDEIPAWDGGLTTAPAGFKGDGRYVDPFPEDKELFRIDQSKRRPVRREPDPGSNRHDQDL